MGVQPMGRGQAQRYLELSVIELFLVVVILLVGGVRTAVRKQRVISVLTSLFRSGTDYLLSSLQMGAPNVPLDVHASVLVDATSGPSALINDTDVFSLKQRRMIH